MTFKYFRDLPDAFTFHIDRLKEGNARFVGNAMQDQDFASQKKLLAEGQSPHIIILTCSDSRIVPNYIFDEECGELFVVRTAGGVLGPAVLGSIEYAAEALRAGLFVVLGHGDCGAVKDALKGARGPRFVNYVIESIAPAINDVKKNDQGGGSVLDRAILENVKLQMQSACKQSVALQELVEKGKLAIVGAIYDMYTGKVEFLDEAIF